MKHYSGTPASVRVKELLAERNRLRTELEQAKKANEPNPATAAANLQRAHTAFPQLNHWLAAAEGTLSQRVFERLLAEDLTAAVCYVVGCGVVERERKAELMRTRIASYDELHRSYFERTIS